MRCTCGAPTLHVSQVTRVSEQEALQCEAYILLYERQRELDSGTTEEWGEGQSKGQVGGRERRTPLPLSHKQPRRSS